MPITKKGYGEGGSDYRDDVCSYCGKTIFPDVAICPYCNEHNDGNGPIQKLTKSAEDRRRISRWEWLAISACFAIPVVAGLIYIVKLLVSR